MIPDWDAPEDNSVTTYYISGPMRGKPDHNRKMFAEVAEALHTNAHMGMRIINPRDNFEGKADLPSSEYLALDLKQVLDSDAIVQLPEWQSSEGAIREAKLGVWAGKKFIRAYVRNRCETDQGEAVEWAFEPIDAPEFNESVRAAALDEARDLITGDRNNAYGPPWQDFARTAAALTAMCYRGPNGRELESHDIAIFVMMVKISRLMWTPTKKDSWVDIAGYSGCGYECSLHDDELKRARAA